MHGVGLVGYSLQCECESGVFFVHKKSGKIRLILNCRRANARFRAPPGTELLSSESFSNIEFDGTGSEKTDLEQLCLHLGVEDVADCFHQEVFLLAVPPGRQSGRPRSRGATRQTRAESVANG